MGLFKKSTPPLVGIDIGSATVKLLQLSRSGSRYRVDYYAIEPLPVGAVVDKQVSDVEAVGDVIRRLLTRSRCKSKYAAAAVAGSAVITKVISMPANLGDEMESQVELEAANHIPYPIDEVNLDFEVIGPLPDHENVSEVLLVASRSENVENRVTALEIGGLTARVIDVEKLSLENAFGLLATNMDIADDCIVALVECGVHAMSLHVVRKKHIFYSRAQDFGGEKMTEKIMSRYGLSREDAELTKRGSAMQEAYEVEVLEPFKEAMAQQVGRLLQFFYAGSEFGSVDLVVLAGGCASIPGVADTVEGFLGIPTVAANPLEKMVLSRRVRAKELAKDAPALMTAVGLALRNFD